MTLQANDPDSDAPYRDSDLKAVYTTVKQSLVTFRPQSSNPQNDNQNDNLKDDLINGHTGIFAPQSIGSLNRSDEILPVDFTASDRTTEAVVICGEQLVSSQTFMYHPKQPISRKAPV
ncbi:hypothetical protein ACHAPF_010630 [Botrytis cinerea]|uniref:Uncharacterized protein n=1 Tax=Botryotinia fuckeliana (strain T4) TaxID=999810 RepID=G2XU25_BOTF4|nr:hypothetical protein BofuT4_P062050.1 [Botrytis cinerea T4]